MISTTFPPVGLNSISADQVPVYEINYTEVNTYADLPIANTQTNETYIVKQATGTWLLGTQKKAGLYYSDGVAWTYMGNSISIDDSIVSNESVWSSSKVDTAKVDKVIGKSLVEDTKVIGYDAHIINATNPHAVTASQVGAYTTSQTDTAIAALVDDIVPSLTSVYSSQHTQDLHNTQAAAIANLATAQCHIIQSSTPALVLNTTHNVLPFSIHVDSTDTNIMTVNDAGNTITFLRNASFNFLSHVLFSSTTSFARTITFELINTADNSVLVNETNVIDIPSGTTEGIALNTLITVGRNGIPSAPLTMRIQAYSTNTGHSIQTFNSILASSSSYDVSSDASGIAFVPVGNVAAVNVQLAIQELDSEKQVTLVSGTNIKTINGATLLGSGNIVISGGSGSVTNYAFLNNSINQLGGSF